MEQEGQWTPSRRAPRLLLSPPLRGELDIGLEAAVLDISASGARLEHRQVLYPGGPYVLTLPLAPQAAPLRLPARVVWSWVHQMEAGGGNGGVIYHSGLEFQGLPAHVGRDLAAYILGGVARAQAGPLRGTLEPPPY